MVNKEELIKGTLQFVDTYNRLPFLKEDNIEVEKLNDENEIGLRPYRALKYIKLFYTSQDKMTAELFKAGLLTNYLIAKKLKIKESEVMEALDGKEKIADTSTRRKLHIFFNKDLYDNGTNSYAKLCSKCKNTKCKQNYWVTVIQCPNYH